MVTFRHRQPFSACLMIGLMCAMCKTHSPPYPTQIPEYCSLVACQASSWLQDSILMLTTPVELFRRKVCSFLFLFCLDFSEGILPQARGTSAARHSFVS
ncbi:hypothetical protein B0H11DRAFT_646989 [Mycena galericulata]|nr:hypothetical protein B0H11DRAFT_646989 [Mycena galericulata]